MHCKLLQATAGFDRGQTREIFEKQENYLKGKTDIFIVQGLILLIY